MSEKERENFFSQDEILRKFSAEVGGIEVFEWRAI